MIDMKPLTFRQMLQVANEIVHDIMLLEGETQVFLDTKQTNPANVKPTIEHVSIKLMGKACLGQNSLLPIANYLDNKDLSWSIEPCKKMVMTHDGSSVSYDPFLELTVYNHDKND